MAPGQTVAQMSAGASGEWEWGGGGGDGQAGSACSRTLARAGEVSAAGSH